MPRSAAVRVTIFRTCCGCRRLSNGAGQLYWHENVKGINWATYLVADDVTGIIAIAVSDLDGDGDADLGTCDSSAHSFVRNSLNVVVAEVILPNVFWIG